MRKVPLRLQEARQVEIGAEVEVLPGRGGAVEDARYVGTQSFQLNGPIERGAARHAWDVAVVPCPCMIRFGSPIEEIGVQQLQYVQEETLDGFTREQ